MIISHKYKFIFIKTHKTAGTSIEIALSKFCGVDDIITPISPRDENIRESLGYKGAQNFVVTYKDLSLKSLLTLLKRRRKVISYWNHIPATSVREQVGESVWNDYYKFTIERNPWDKVISWYYWLKSVEKINMSLSKFIETLEDYNVSDFHLYSHDREVIVDEIFKDEDLNYFTTTISARLNFPETIILPRAKSDSRKKNSNCQNILSSIELDKIAKTFEQEIRLLSYYYKY